MFNYILQVGLNAAEAIKQLCDFPSLSEVTLKNTGQMIDTKSHQIKETPCNLHNMRDKDFHDKDKTVVRPSYLYNGNTYTGKTTSLYWDGPQGCCRGAWRTHAADNKICSCICSCSVNIRRNIDLTIHLCILFVFICKKSCFVFRFQQKDEIKLDALYGLLIIHVYLHRGVYTREVLLHAKRERVRVEKD